MTRTEPPTTPEARPRRYVSFLDYLRDTLRLKTEGLDAAQLDQRLEPSTMTLGGLLKHLAFVEDWWFNEVYADGPSPEPWASVDWKADSDWDWHSAARETPARGCGALYDETVAASDRIMHEALAHPGALESLSRRTFRFRPGPPLQPPVDPGAPGRGVRPPRRSRRPPPRVHRRSGGRLAPPTGHSMHAQPRRPGCGCTPYAAEWALDVRPAGV